MLTRIRNANQMRYQEVSVPASNLKVSLAKILKEEGIRFFFLESHGILYATPRPKYGVFAPIYCPNGVAAFSRDMETAHQVWSAESGYPGDPDYREFYRDIGFDLDYDYVKPYIHESGLRLNTGIKYYRITDRKISGICSLSECRDRPACHGHRRPLR